MTSYLQPYTDRFIHLICSANEPSQFKKVILPHVALHAGVLVVAAIPVVLVNLVGAEMPWGVGIPLTLTACVANRALAEVFVSFVAIKGDDFLRWDQNRNFCHVTFSKKTGQAQEVFVNRAIKKTPTIWKPEQQQAYLALVEEMRARVEKEGLQWRKPDLEQKYERFEAHFQAEQALLKDRIQKELFEQSTQHFFTTKCIYQIKYLFAGCTEHLFKKDSKKPVTPLL